MCEKLLYTSTFMWYFLWYFLLIKLTVAETSGSLSTWIYPHYNKSASSPGLRLRASDGVQTPCASPYPFLSSSHSVPSVLQPMEGCLASQRPEHDRMGTLLKGMMGNKRKWQWSGSCYCSPSSQMPVDEDGSIPGVTPVRAVAVTLCLSLSLSPTPSLIPTPKQHLALARIFAL